jgi:hypothetical protein
MKTLFSHIAAGGKLGDILWPKGWIVATAIEALIGIILLGSAAQAAPGFYADWTKAPPAVSHAAASVYRLAVVSPEIGFRVTIDRLSQYKASLKAKLADAKLTGAEFRWRMYEAETPDQDGSVRVRDLVACATGFLWKDKSTLLTVRHSFTDYFLGFPVGFYAANTYSEARSAIASAPPEMVIFDRNDKVILDSRKGRKPVALGFNGHWNILNSVNPLLTRWDLVTRRLIADVVEIKLPIQLEGSPLEFVSASVSIGKDAYLVSFPGQTTGRLTQQGAPDSDGLSQRYSYGKVMTVPEPYLRNLIRHSPAPGAVDPYVASHVFNDADANHGTSGAPILTSDGKVAGIYTTHWQNGKIPLDQSYSDRGGYGIAAAFILSMINAANQQ